ncbi:hypothetical protein MUG78_17750 [Gordonia alkaliphila]|uniref:hypothetical protein n=1 Tax=Gordonia alkaliphila TaxID=1053547 RepID=UPI001FF4550A|nr:hypothetical protein [Gordonia alkaliphila]MCK0441246.1 hypothetical protein [Gordonia alkaliphila]
MSETVTVGDGGAAVQIFATTGAEDGALIIDIDTRNLPADRVLRVYVNDGSVYSARIGAGDHNLDYIGEYIDEVNSKSGL